MLSDILYYFVYASAVLLYGVGLDRVVVLSPKPSHGVLACLKMLLSVSASSAISYLINCYLLVPVHLTELAPFFAVLVFGVRAAMAVHTAVGALRTAMLDVGAEHRSAVAMHRAHTALHGGFLLFLLLLLHGLLSHCAARCKHRHQGEDDCLLHR